MPSYATVLLGHYSSQYADRSVYWAARNRALYQKDIICLICDSFWQVQTVITPISIRTGAQEDNIWTVQQKLPRSLVKFLVFRFFTVCVCVLHLFSDTVHAGQSCLKVKEHKWFWLASWFMGHGCFLYLTPAEGMSAGSNWNWECVSSSSNLEPGFGFDFQRCVKSGFLFRIVCPSFGHSHLRLWLPLRKCGDDARPKTSPLRMRILAKLSRTSTLFRIYIFLCRIGTLGSDGFWSIWGFGANQITQSRNCGTRIPWEDGVVSFIRGLSRWHRNATYLLDTRMRMLMAYSHYVPQLFVLHQSHLKHPEICNGFSKAGLAPAFEQRNQVLSVDLLGVVTCFDF